MSRINGGNRPSTPKAPTPERPGAERSDSARDPKRTPDVQAHGAVRTFQGRSDFEPGPRPTPRSPPVLTSPTPTEAAAIAGADVELALLSEVPDADAQGGLASAMLHAHADEPASQAR